MNNEKYWHSKTQLSSLYKICNKKQIPRHIHAHIYYYHIHTNFRIQRMRKKGKREKIKWVQLTRTQPYVVCINT